MPSIATLSALGGGLQGASQGLRTFVDYLIAKQERDQEELERKRRNALLGIFEEPQYEEIEVGTAAPEPGEHLPGGPISPIDLARAAATGPATEVPQVTAPDFGASRPLKSSLPDPTSMPPNLKRSGDKLVERREVPSGIRLPTGEYYYPTLSSAYQLAVATAERELRRQKEVEQFKHQLQTQAEREVYERQNKSAYQLGKKAGVLKDEDYDPNTDYTWVNSYLDYLIEKQRAQAYGAGVTNRTAFQLESLRIQALRLMLEWEKLGLSRQEAANKAVQEYAESIRPYFDMQNQYVIDETTGELRPLRFDEAINRFRQDVYDLYGIMPNDPTKPRQSQGTGELIRNFFENPTGSPAAADPEPSLPPGLEELRTLWRPGMTIDYSIFTDPNDRDAVRRWVEWKQRNPGR